MITSQYYFLSETIQGSFKEQLEAALLEWRSDWLNLNVDISLVEINGNVSLENNLPEYVLYFDDVLFNCKDQQLLQEMVVGREWPISEQENSNTFASLIQQLSTIQISEFIMLLCGEMPADNSEHRILPSPYVEVKLQINDGEMSFYFSSNWMSKHFPLKYDLSGLPKLAALPTALLASQSSVEIKAGQIKMTYGQLTKLKVGDVLLSDMLVGDVFTAEIHHKPVFTSFLGQHEDNKAIIVESIKF
jgi:hypothetical protein